MIAANGVRLAGAGCTKHEGSAVVRPRELLEQWRTVAETRSRAAREQLVSRTSFQPIDVTPSAHQAGKRDRPSAFGAAPT